jgi:hypothetical protein
MHINSFIEKAKAALVLDKEEDLDILVICFLEEK